MEEQTVKDPAKIGIKGLQGINRLKEMGANIPAVGDNYISYMQQVNSQALPEENIGFVGINDSRYDKKISSRQQLNNLNNTRGELQPWYDQIGSGIAKGALLAGTTFLDGTIGLVIGANKAIQENKLSGLWNNDFSKAMQDVNDWAEKAMPNYYTDQEMSNDWQDNVFTANFIGDKFLKNLGFTVGAFYSGNVYAKGLGLGIKGIQTSALGQSINAVRNATQAPQMIVSGVGATISAVNEGRVQALNNSDDWYKTKELELTDSYNSRVNTINTIYKDSPLKNHLLKKEEAAYNETIGKLTEDKLKVGNLDMLTNLPILLSSNLVQFGKLYADGFKTARKATNIVKKNDLYKTTLNSRKGITRALLNPFSEGMEELAQSASGRIAGNYYGDMVDNYYLSKLDPEAEAKTVAYIKSFAQGINETVNDNSSWEEFMIGTLTGAMGMPRFRGIRNEQGNLQSPITLEGGIVGEYKDYKEQQHREENIVNYLNNRIQSPEFLNYYRGMIRHNKLQEDMDVAVENNDAFEFKNAEHAQLISDISMFDNAGKIYDLEELINSAYDVSDENLQSIFKETTTQLEDGSFVGPFSDKSGNPLFSTDKGKQEMIDKLTQTQEEIKNNIDNYVDIKNGIDVKYGQNLNDEQLEELTYLKSQIGNWSDRSKKILEEIKPTINSAITTISDIAKSPEVIKTLGLDEKILNKNLETFAIFQGLNNDTLLEVLANNPKTIQGIKDVVSDTNIISKDELDLFNNKLDDLVKLNKASKKFNDTLVTYINSPETHTKTINKNTERLANQELTKQTNSLKESLISSNNLQEFRTNLDNINDNDIKERTLKDLEVEDNQLAKDYREVNNYNQEVSNIINSANADALSIAGANKLLQEQYNNSNNLLEMANPSSIYINDLEVINDNTLSPEDNIKNFQKSQYILLEAMYKVNNNNIFKNRFSDNYKELKTPIAEEQSSETTGDSQTTKIDPVTTSNYEDTDYYIPVGDVSENDVFKDNLELNNSYDNTDNESKRFYYRPTIPELHIEGSKEGDFRPFNTVVKERDPGVDFDVLYNYLRDSGAFDYVNNGHIKQGDDIGFMIDSTLEDNMKSYSWYKGPTILMIDSRNNQVIGSLDSNPTVINRYEGLQNLQDNIIKEYNQRNTSSNNSISVQQIWDFYLKNTKEIYNELGSNDNYPTNLEYLVTNGASVFESVDMDKLMIEISKIKAFSPLLGTSKTTTTNNFISSINTKVSKIMVGKIPLIGSSRSLANIPNIDSTTSIFGIVKNGVLSTNDKIKDSNIIKPMNMENKEGRMYLLIPNARNMYSPATVRVKHFNSEEFNIDNIEIQNTKMYNNIMSSIKTLASALSEEDVSLAMQGLSRHLFLKNVLARYSNTSKGAVLRLSKIERDNNGKIVYETKDGKKLRKGIEKTIFLNSIDSLEVLAVFGAEEGYIPESNVKEKSTDTITREIVNVLQEFNLPIQVNLDMLNSSGYNKLLIDSNILSSNLREARVISNWFTTDYIDNDGNIQRANNPVSIQTNGNDTPVNGTESVISGIPIISIHSNKEYYIDLTTNTIKDTDGNTIAINDKNKILFDIAYAESIYGDNTEGSTMVDNKIVLDSGLVLDRTKQVYLSQEEGDKIKSIIKGIETKKITTEDIINQISENQKLVDKDRTDSDSYYILEDDGNYHPYDRVHTRLGNNWLGDTNNNSSIALDAGNAVDNIIRNFFYSNDTPSRPDNLSEEAFKNLIDVLTDIRIKIESRGERFLTNNIVVFNKYSDGTRIAGEIDILSVDSKGNFKIYDVKTSRYSFSEFTDKYGNKQNYFENQSNKQKMSTKNYYTLQLSAYKNLFESQYNTSVTNLAILPFVLSYKDDIVDTITKESGITIDYNPAVNVPSNTVINNNSVLPIFDSTIELQNPINNVLPEYLLDNSTVGYFTIEDKVYTGYLSKLGDVNDKEIYITKIPNFTKGYGNSESHVATINYYVVFPNGNSILMAPNQPVSTNEKDLKDKIFKAIANKPTKVDDMSNIETLISKNRIISPPNYSVSNETASTILNDDNSSGASKTLHNESSIRTSKRRRPIKLRQVDNNNSLWNQDKEIAWIKEVLPQVVEQDRLNIVKGLINVAELGATAWGQFNDGIITLSDISAEGTTYHEAFHVVFELLLNPKEQQDLLEEARSIYGNKSDSLLEEDMAEGFREYVMSKDNKNLGTKILNFFKSLFSKVTNWNSINPNLYSLYKNINNGKYKTASFVATSFVGNNINEENFFNNLSKETQKLLLNKGWTQTKFDTISPQERDQAIRCISL